MKWNEGLSGPALEIARTDNSPLRVLAGPGTGKTFSLMRRVTRLLEHGAEPRRIFLVTFARTAAKDLQDSLKEIGIEGASEVQAGTLHSYCFSLLSQENVLKMTGRTPRPLMDFEEDLLRRDLVHLKHAPGLRDAKSAIEALSAAWARNQTDEVFSLTKTDREFKRGLDAWLLFHEAMLLHEIVPEALGFLQTNPEADVHKSFDHVVVDEYQDLNRAEQELVLTLADPGSLTIVGDEDQSIYAFKYAHPQGIAEFDDHHPNTQDESLSQCRRCPHRVVSMANHLIDANPNRAPRELEEFPEQEDGEVHIVQWNSIQSEANGIAEFIRKQLDDKRVTPGQVLVLAPRREFGLAIRDALQAKEIEAHSFFKEQGLKDDLAKERFLLLTLLANPEDRVALRAWVGLGSQTALAGGWHRVREHCEESGCSPRQALDQLSSDEIQLPHTQKIVERYRALQAQIEKLQALTGQELVDELFPEQEQELSELRRIAESILAVDTASTKDLCDAVRSAVTQPELPMDVDYVRVMSLHKSKGLTADLVVVAGCVEGLIPSRPKPKTLQSQARAEMEEQRRLFYVALTRPRKTLLLSSVTSIPMKDALRMGAKVETNRKVAKTFASSFLRELGPRAPKATTGAEFLKSFSS